jgi:hypothetical protein
MCFVIGVKQKDKMSAISSKLCKGYSESPGLWNLSIIQSSKQPENTAFLKLDLFQSSGEGRERHWIQRLRLAVSKALNRVGFTLPLPKDPISETLYFVVI